MNTIHELFNAKAQYNKWLNELTESEKELIYEMMEETRFKNLDFPDLDDAVDSVKKALHIGGVMPSIGRTYSIIENGKRIFGTVESHQGDTGKFWVKWNDGEITLESKIDNCR